MAVSIGLPASGVYKSIITKLNPSVCPHVIKLLKRFTSFTHFIEKESVGKLTVLDGLGTYKI